MQVPGEAGAVQLKLKTTEPPAIASVALWVISLPESCVLRPALSWPQLALTLRPAPLCKALLTSNSTDIASPVLTLMEGTMKPTAVLADA